MKKKGFTLIELSGVFVLVAVILLIAVPTVLSILKNNKEQEYNNFLNNVYIAAEAYISEKDIEVVSGDKVQITISQLIESGFLKGDLLNTKENKKAKDLPEMTVKITLNDNDYKYELLDKKEKEYEGVPNKTYSVGDHITYGSNDWIVVKDKGVAVDLIYNEYVGSGNYNESLNFIDNWLNENYKKDINNGGITKQSNNKYFRFINASELDDIQLNSKFNIKNPYWTSISDNSNNTRMVVAFGDGTYQYSSSTSSQQIYYSMVSYNVYSQAVASKNDQPNYINMGLKYLTISGYKKERQIYGSTTYKTAKSGEKFNYCFSETGDSVQGFCIIELNECTYVPENQCNKYDIYSQFSINLPIVYRPIITVNKGD